MICDSKDEEERVGSGGKKGSVTVDSLNEAKGGRGMLDGKVMKERECSKSKERSPRVRKIKLVFC
jgi:hypothetical protein